MRKLLSIIMKKITFFFCSLTPDTIRKEMEAIAAEIQNENLQQQKQQQAEDREATDRLLASPALANHPAIAAATASAAWR